MIISNHDNKSDQTYYVGDSRVKIKGKKLIPRDYADFPGKTEAFLPDFLLREWMVGSVFLVGFLTLTLVETVEVGEAADINNSRGYIPFPDWYFLFLYQILKYKWASASLKFLGTVVLPGAAFGALMLAPWLDTSKERRPLKRPIASSIMLLSVISIIILTYGSVEEHKTQTQRPSSFKNEKPDDLDHEGYKIYSSTPCISCHGSNLEGSNGPSLLGAGCRFDKAQLEKIIKYGKGLMPGNMIPYQKGQPNPKIDKIVDFLSKQRQGCS